jgi:hypothetical protein
VGWVHESEDVEEGGKKNQIDGSFGDGAAVGVVEVALFEVVEAEFLGVGEGGDCTNPFMKKAGV